jgi:hypothetical protein
MVICLPSRRTLTSEGNMPAMEAMVRPVEKSCHAFYTLMLFRPIGCETYESSLDSNDNQDHNS